jgi:acetylornithine deacetylase/succinyl-diaminopimelate desuccinylase-like protein
MTRNTYRFALFLFLVAGLGLLACGAPETEDQMAPVTEALGIRAAGDTEIAPDMAQIPEELQKVFQHIDDNVDRHTMNLRRWIQQPSISNSGEGIPESAQMVKGFFDQLGCQQSQVYEIPMTEWGQPGNPVVYANCNYGAERTLLIYWMYDTMPITQPEAWVLPPFDGEFSEFGPFKKVMIGRGTTNSKGPQMTQWNAFHSIYEETGSMPVNLIFIAEGDEERMSIGLRQFVRENPELFRDAEAMYRFGSQSRSGAAGIGGGSEGCVYIELTTSGASWGRGPVASNIHGANKRSTDAPALRHVKMLASLVSDDGNRALVPGFYDGADPLSEEEEAMFRTAAENIDMAVAAENIGVARFISDDPLTYLKSARYGISFNMDGVWAGNMYPGGAGAILPNRITSKHNMRYVPSMDGLEMVQKIRDYLDEQGYEDVEMTIVGDVPWSKSSYDNRAAHSLLRAYDIFGIRYRQPLEEESILGGYWPAYLFSGRDAALPDGTDLAMPIVGGAGGHGGGAHAANEFWVIEGAGEVYGMAGGEKTVATFLYAYAGLLPDAPAAAGMDQD